MLDAIQKTPVMQSEVMLETMFTASGSSDGTWGTKTARIKKKKIAVSTRTTMVLVFDTRGWSSGWSGMMDQG